MGSNQHNGISLMQDEVVFQGSKALGAETVLSDINEGYQGPCAVLINDGSDKLICAFPNPEEARKAGMYASKPDGGYGSTKLVACSVHEITHTDCDSWVFF